MRNAKFRGGRDWRILKAVSEQILALMKGLVTSIVSAEAGKNMGGAVANFYKELKSSGMPDEAVMRMTQEYAETFNDLGKLMRETVGQRGELQRPKAAKGELDSSLCLLLWG